MWQRRWRPQRLATQLVLSYCIVTLVAALAIESALSASWLAQHDVQPSTTPAQVLMKTNVQAIAPFLQQAPPDTEALRNWFAIPLYEALANTWSTVNLVAIVDQQGHVLAAASCTRAQMIATASKQCGTYTTQQADTFVAESGTQTVIQAATNSITPSPVKTGTTSEGNAFLVLPIVAGKQRYAGIIVAFFHDGRIPSGQTGPNWHALVSAFWSQWQPVTFLFVLLGSALSSVVGILFARRLALRFRQIAVAAEAWTQGAFAVMVADRERDELGQLSTRLNQMASQLQALVATRHQLAILEERQRMQRELHDTIKQHLFAIAMHMAAARSFFPTDAQQTLAHIMEAEQGAGFAQRELTALIVGLLPTDLEGKPFATALTDLCQRWTHQTHIITTLHIEENSLPVEAQTALYRVTQEALANIARHSNATEVTVILQQHHEQIELLIHDNGQGFDPSTPTNGMGVSNMGERMAAIGGTVQIESSAAGTSVRATVPGEQGACYDTKSHYCLPH